MDTLMDDKLSIKGQCSMYFTKSASLADSNNGISMNQTPHQKCNSCPGTLYARDSKPTHHTKTPICSFHASSPTPSVVINIPVTIHNLGLEKRGVLVPELGGFAVQGRCAAVCQSCLSLRGNKSEKHTCLVPQGEIGDSAEPSGCCTQQSTCPSEYRDRCGPKNRRWDDK